MRDTSTRPGAPSVVAEDRGLHSTHAASDGELTVPPRPNR